MATDTEIRAWLRDRGRGDEVTKRGKVRQGLRDEYAAEHGQAPAGDTDYDGSVTEADFGPEARDDFDPATGEILEQESTPRQHPSTTRRARRESASARARSIWSRATSGQAEPAKGKAAAASRPARPRRDSGPWMPTSAIIEHFWSQLAWAARPLPPVQKILAAQAPTAGVMLQDSLKDTFVDRVLLQPAARAEDRIQGLSATLGPALFTTAIAVGGGAVENPQKPGEPLLDDEGVPVWNGPTQVMVTGLRFSLMSWVKVAGKKADEIIAAAEELDDLGAQADELIRWILSPTAPGANPKDTEREARQRGRDFIIREPSSPTSSSPAKTSPAPDKVRGVPGGATQAEMTAHLEGMAQSSLRPAPAGKPDRG